MSDDDPEKRIRELEQGLSQPGGPPPPRADGWETYAVQPQRRGGPVFVKRGGLRLLPVALMVFGLVVPAVIGVVVFFAVVDPFAPDVREQSAEGLTAIVEAMRDEFGDTMGYELAVHPEHAVLERPKPGADRTMEMFTYRDGDWNSWDNEMPVFSDDHHLADLSAFDAAAVAGVLAGAPEKFGLRPEDSAFLLIEGSESGLTLTVRANSPYGGEIAIEPDGTVTGFVPPSE